MFKIVCVSIVSLALINAAAPIAAAQEWKWINSWGGNPGSRTTEKFTVTSSTWRIQWNVSKADYGSFTVMIMDDKGTLVSYIATEKPGTSGISYVHKSGRYYLTITSTHMDYLVTAEEQP